MDSIDCFLTDYDDFAMSFSFSKIKVREKNNIYWVNVKLSPRKIIKFSLSAKIETESIVKILRVS